MKRMILAICALILLCGCAGNVEPDTGPATQITTLPETTGIYIRYSQVEEQTAGAVKMFDLPDSNYIWLAGVGEHIVLASEGETGGITLMVYTGEECTVYASCTAPESMKKDCRWSATYNGIVYYDAEGNQAVVLDSRLTGEKAYPLPELDGLPLFSIDGGSVYYCKGNQIRAYDLDSGIDRLIRSHSCISQTLLYSAFNDKLLCCELTDEAGQTQVVYVSSQTGETVNKDQNLTQLFTLNESYLALRTEGVMQQRIFGVRGEQPAQLRLPQNTSVFSALSAGGAVEYGAEGQTLQLRFYDLSSGMLTGQESLIKVGMPVLMLDHKATKSVWFVASDPETGEQALFRWDPRKSSAQDETVYSTPWYNASNPDQEGLGAVQDRVDALNKTHGIDIRIWSKAVKEPGGLALEAEHQPDAITMCLDALEPVLNTYPEKFLYRSVNRKLHISIVRSISGEITGTQYWYDGDAYIVLSVGCDVADVFTKGMGYVVDSHVLGNSPLVDDWEQLNPEGFVYAETSNQQHLEGDARAFVDEASMESVNEDRSRIFWQAMKPDNAQVFASPVMQSKLRQLCLGIRDAWRLEKKTDVYRWEQYLVESVAYQG